MKKGWKYVVNNKLRGAYGQIDYAKKKIEINKKKHRKGSDAKRITPNKDGSEKMLMTMQHELVHKSHPKKGEKGVEKLARAMVSKMSPKKKAKIYSKFN